MTDGSAAEIRVLAGRYQVGDLLGRGGMAEVHSGTDARLGRTVAIKLLKPSLATDPAFRTRFRQEAQAAARMAHPTIVRVFDAGEETVSDESGSEIQLPFIVMERVEGELLKDLIAAGPLPVAEALRIVEGILTALEYSHRAGVVHRDIKPGNVMVTAAGQVKVMDFGIARAISDSSATIAQTSAILGTAQYFSPEQARGEAVDARTDLYSTGVVLYELLTGRPPFRGDTPVATAYQHISEQPVPPSAINPEISPAINAVVMRALAKDRDDRFQSAADFARDLEIAGSGKVPDRSPVAEDFNATLFGVNPTSTAASAATLRRLADDVDERPIRSQSRPPVAWVWGGIALVIVVLVAAGLWIVNLQGPALGSNASIVVSDIVGQVYTDAGAALQSQGLAPVRVDQSIPTTDTNPAHAEGHVLRTEPVAGTRVNSGQTVTVYVSTGPQKVTLGGLSYQSEQSAKDAITAAGLTYGSTSTAHSPSVGAGKVIGVVLRGATDTTPSSAAQQIVAGSTVDLVVSDGKVDVPSFLGQQVAAAQQALTGVDLQLQPRLIPDRSCSGQAVKSQSLTGPSPQKSTIDIRYCAGGSGSGTASTPAPTSGAGG